MAPDAYLRIDYDFPAWLPFSTLFLEARIFYVTLSPTPLAGVFFLVPMKKPKSVWSLGLWVQPAIKRLSLQGILALLFARHPSLTACIHSPH